MALVTRLVRLLHGARWDHDGGLGALRVLGSMDGKREIHVLGSLAEASRRLRSSPYPLETWGDLWQKVHQGRSDCIESINRSCWYNEMQLQFITDQLGEGYRVFVRTAFSRTAGLAIQKSDWLTANLYDSFDLINLLVALEQHFEPSSLVRALGALLSSRIGIVVKTKAAVYGVRFPDIRVNARGRLHSEVGPAVWWDEEDSGYWLHGKDFRKDLWEKVTGRWISAEDVLSEMDPMRQDIIFAMVGAEEVHSLLRPFLLHKSKRGNELYVVFRDGSAPIKLLRYRCPSTGRRYVKYVPPGSFDADAAMAWCLRLSRTEYEALKMEG